MILQPLGRTDPRLSLISFMYALLQLFHRAVPPLWQRGARGDFKIPLTPPLQKGDITGATHHFIIARQPRTGAKKNGGAGRNRTADTGFADPCITTLLPRQWTRKMNRNGCSPCGTAPKLAQHRHSPCWRSSKIIGVSL